MTSTWHELTIWMITLTPLHMLPAKRIQKVYSDCRGELIVFLGAMVHVQHLLRTGPRAPRVWRRAAAQAEAPKAAAKAGAAKPSA